MRRRLRDLVLSLVLSFVLAPPVMAQSQMDQLSSNRIVSFGLGGGVSVPVSDAGDTFENGFNGQGFVRLNLGWLPIAPRLDFTFTKFDLDDAQVATPGTGQIMAGLANFQVPILKLGPIQPYLVAGVGAYNLKTETEGATPTSLSDTKFGVNGGGGVVIRLGSLLSAYVEGRVDNVFTEEEGLIETDQIQVVPVSFGVVF